MGHVWARKVIVARDVTAASVRKMAEVRCCDESATVSYNGGRVQPFCLLKVRDLYITAISLAVRSVLCLYEGTVHERGTRWRSWLTH